MIAFVSLFLSTSPVNFHVHLKLLLCSILLCLQTSTVTLISCSLVPSYLDFPNCVSLLSHDFCDNSLPGFMNLSW
eukprot:m.246475 g.246475  ORF g.246475 m.246475 type:complete len:75 (-) comp26647_c1_seq13:758-982(-)